MASPQIENGYTKIANELMEQIYYHDLNATQIKIILITIRYTYGFRRLEHELSLKFISKGINISVRHISNELKTLIDRNIIQVIEEQKGTIGRIIKLNKNYNTWKNKDLLMNNCSILNNTTIEQHFTPTDEQHFTPTDEQHFTQERKTKERKKAPTPKKETLPDKNDLMEQYSFTCKDGSIYVLPGEVYRTFKELYPNVNIDEELNRMKGWIYANSNRRKTQRGMKPFINRWLSKPKIEYNNFNQPKSTRASETKYTPFKPANIPIEIREAGT